jgi:hypothetical protein
MSDPFTEPLKLEADLRKLGKDLLLEHGIAEEEKALASFLTGCCIASILREDPAYLVECARNLGLHPKEMEKRADIWDKIVRPIAEQGDSIPPLAPKFFEVALKAKKPDVALRVAADAQARDPKFSPYRFQRLVYQELKSDDDVLLTCLNCHHFQELKEVPVILEIEGERFPLTVTLKACRLKGILGVYMNSDLNFLAENCEEYFP